MHPDLRVSYETLVSYFSVIHFIKGIEDFWEYTLFSALIKHEVRLGGGYSLEGRISLKGQASVNK